MVFKAFIPTLWFLVVFLYRMYFSLFIVARYHNRLPPGHWIKQNMIEVLFLFILHKKIELFRLFETDSTYHDL